MIPDPTLCTVVWLPETGEKLRTVKDFESFMESLTGSDETCIPISAKAKLHPAPCGGDDCLCGIDIEKSLGWAGLLKAKRGGILVKVKSRGRLDIPRISGTRETHLRLVYKLTIIGAGSIKGIRKERKLPPHLSIPRRLTSRTS